MRMGLDNQVSHPCNVVPARVLQKFRKDFWSSARNSALVSLLVSLADQ
jgi:hypothetical protein